MKTCLRNFYFELAFSRLSSQLCAEVCCCDGTAGIVVCRCSLQSAEFTIVGDLYYSMTRALEVATLARAWAEARPEV